MPAPRKPSPQAPKPSDKKKDDARFAKGEDERLSRNAGYGRADSTPKST